MIYRISYRMYFLPSCYVIEELMLCCVFLYFEAARVCARAVCVYVLNSHAQTCVFINSDFIAEIVTFRLVYSLPMIFFLVFLFLKCKSHLPNLCWKCMYYHFFPLTNLTNSSSLQNDNNTLFRLRDYECKTGTDPGFLRGVSTSKGGANLFWSNFAKICIKWKE